MDPAVGSIMQVGVTVSDVETALAYYQGVLGLSLLFRPSPSLAFLSGGAVRIMLTSPQGAGTVGANSILYFRVEGIEAVYAGIVARGSTSEQAPRLAARMPDHELWLAFVRDPDGNLVGLMEEKRAA